MFLYFYRNKKCFLHLWFKLHSAGVAVFATFGSCRAS